jgi:hypothetical protein
MDNDLWYNTGAPMIAPACCAQAPGAGIRLLGCPRCAAVALAGEPMNAVIGSLV